jgi:hypothetical protein
LSGRGVAEDQRHVPQPRHVDRIRALVPHRRAGREAHRGRRDGRERGTGSEPQRLGDAQHRPHIVEAQLAAPGAVRVGDAQVRHVHQPVPPIDNLAPWSSASCHPTRTSFAVSVPSVMSHEAVVLSR